MPVPNPYEGTKCRLLVRGIDCVEYPCLANWVYNPNGLAIYWTRSNDRVYVMHLGRYDPPLLGWWEFPADEYDDAPEEWRRRTVAMALRKVTTGKDVTACQIKDPDFAKKYPTLFEYVTKERYDDEERSPRQPSTLTIYLYNGLLGATLKDRDSDCAKFANGRSLAEVLDALEAVVKDDRVPWREDRTKTGKSSRR